ncbi:hypothetical protein ABE438_17710 [Bosea sp. TWI1241]|uniref:hypothetical protein n=1 Tax=Bosea sp. TWI1241 TaxID=3148904 RepID=UPI00320B4ABB
MRLALAIITLALAGCTSTSTPPEAQRPAGNYTVGTAHCSKFSWGTAQMAECLEKAAQSQATLSDAGNG